MSVKCQSALSYVEKRYINALHYYLLSLLQHQKKRIALAQYANILHLPLNQNTCMINIQFKIAKFSTDCRTCLNNTFTVVISSF